MFIANNMKDYVILDAGEGMKLEKWGGVTLSRPDPQVIWAKQKPELWSGADAEYIRSDSGGGNWSFKKKLPERWMVELEGLKFYVRPTGFKHTGLFPEQSANWAFMREKIKTAAFRPKVLNLFAYTGGATCACLSAGASVVHVDAAKSMTAWAKENVTLNNLDDRPVRFIVDDCLKFVLREQRRGNTYDAIIMDPPSYGRGAGGQVWKIEESLYEFVLECSKLMSKTPLFFIINSYTTGLSGVVSSNIIKSCLPKANIEAGDLCIPIVNSDMLLPCGTTARWHV